MSTHPHMDDDHVDAACAWLNIEHDVLGEVAERDFGIAEVKLTLERNGGSDDSVVRRGHRSGRSAPDVRIQRSCNGKHRRLTPIRRNPRSGARFARKTL